MSRNTTHAVHSPFPPKPRPEVPGRHLCTPLSRLAAAIGRGDPGEVAEAARIMRQYGYELVHISEMKAEGA